MWSSVFTNVLQGNILSLSYTHTHYLLQKCLFHIVNNWSRSVAEVPMNDNFYRLAPQIVRLSNGGRRWIIRQNIPCCWILSGVQVNVINHLVWRFGKKVQGVCERGRFGETPKTMVADLGVKEYTWKGELAFTYMHVIVFSFTSA